MTATIASLIQQLKHPEEAQRRIAAEHLGELKAEEAIQPLIEALSSDLRSVAEVANDALVKIGTLAVAEAITPLLGTEQPTLRNDVAEMLPRMGSIALPPLVRALKHSDHDIRQFAVECLAKMRLPESRSFLLEVLDDPNINVAAVAAETLGMIGNDETVPYLIQHWDRDIWMKGACLRALGEIGTPLAREAVIGELSNTDPLIKLSAIQALGKMSQAEGIHVLLPILKEQPELFGEEVILALGEILHRQTDANQIRYIHDISLTPLYTAAAAAGKLTVRLSAIDLLGNLREEYSLPFLLMLYEDAESEVRKAALKAVVSLAPKDINPILERLHNPMTSMKAQAGLLDTLGRLKRPESLPAILQFLDNSHITLQRVALNAIFPPVNHFIEQKLRHILISSIGEIREHALIAIQRLKDQRFLHDVIRFLHDPEYEVRIAADAAFVTLAAESGDKLIYSFLNSFDQEERRLAFECFSQQHPAQIETRFIEGLQDSDPVIRKISIKALVNVGLEQAVELIQPMFEDKHEMVVIAAIRAYGALKRENCRLFLEAFLSKTPNPRYRYQSLMALGQIGAEASLEVLLPYLKQEDIYCRLAAIEAIQAIGTPPAIALLQNLYPQENNPEIRSALAKVLLPAA